MAFNELFEGCETVLEPAMALMHCLFVTLGSLSLVREVFGHFLSLATKLNEVEFADGYAALAMFDPVATFENECNFKIWLHHTSSEAFMESINIVKQDWEMMPAHVQAKMQSIHDRLIENKYIDQ